MTLIETRNITKFSFILILEQSKTEEYLRRNGVVIDRQGEFVDFAMQNDSEHLTEVTVELGPAIWFE